MRVGPWFGILENFWLIFQRNISRPILVNRSTDNSNILGFSENFKLSVDRFWISVDRFRRYCSILLSGWDTVENFTVSVDRFGISVDRFYCSFA